MQRAQERSYYRDPESRRQYHKREYLENPEQTKQDYQKRNIRKIHSQK